MIHRVSTSPWLVPVLLLVVSVLWVQGVPAAVSDGQSVLQPIATLSVDNASADLSTTSLDSDDSVVGLAWLVTTGLALVGLGWRRV